MGKLVGTGIGACPKCHTADNVVGVQMKWVYDGVLWWQCLDCGASWHRWPEGHYLYTRAANFLRAGKEA